MGKARRWLRRALMVWITLVITAIALGAVYPPVMEHINGSVATVHTAIIGLFSLVLRSLSRDDVLEDS